MKNDDKPEFRCTFCGDKCELVEETHDAPAAHCNYGVSSTFHTGVMVSECCLTDFEEI